MVRNIENGPDVLFIDRHLVHEVTSPVAFLGLKSRGIDVLHPEKTFATADHNTPTINQHLPVQDPLSANQLKALEENSKEHGISYWGLGHEKMGLFMSLVLNMALHNLVQLLSVGIHIRLPTVLLGPSLSVLVLLRWKWF